VILLSDSTLKALKVVVIDPVEEVWCFRDEIGKKERSLNTFSSFYRSRCSLLNHTNIR